ncbi:MAG: hypothetical protein INR73_25975, partial [Williamsia sp.]|nr:hypothetical protein [Williamsia sp.]
MNSSEKKLTQTNVTPSTFGKLFSRTVDDQIYAQPLIVANLTIGGKARNVVYVATVNNTLYAFDADDASASTPLWKVSLTPSGYRAVKNTDMTGACDGNYQDFTGNMGTVGTPVIDLATKTLYVVAHSVLTTNSATNIQYLHAIDILTGAEKANSPVLISAAVFGGGDGQVNGTINFNPQRQNQRPGLLLYNGVVYIAWASYCDWSPYHGWVLGYDATSLQRKYIYNDTPQGGTGGIWMSGQAPAVDDQGFIYLSTGNGTVGAPNDPNYVINRGESILKMSTASGSLAVTDFFTPHNWPDLEANDQDYGCDGVMLIPQTRLSISGSKNGIVYLVNTDKMGKTSDNDTGARQIIDANSSLPDQKHVHGTPVYYRGPNNKEFMYLWGENSLLKQIPFIRKNSRFNLTTVRLGSTILPGGMPGAMLAVSSNGIKAKTGILWASHPLSGDANAGTVPGVIQAFAA